MKIKIKLIIPVILFCVQINAQSYEGYIGKASVWVDLTIPKSDGLVTGSYFYKKHGSELKLSGTIIGKRISLFEKVDENKISGYFDCSFWSDSITGTWKQNKISSSIKVSLYKTNPAYKENAKTPKPEDLILSDSSSLGDELDHSYWKDYDYLKDRAPLEIEFDGKNILSTTHIWETMAAYVSDGTDYHTFDLVTKQEIVLWNEIDKDKKVSFNNYLCERIQPELTKDRNNYSDEVWVDVFGINNKSGNIKISVDKHFIITDVYKWNTYYIDNKYLHFIISGYFDFFHTNRDMDLSFDIHVTYAELDKYLKKDSVLKRLIDINQ